MSRRQKRQTRTVRFLGGPQHETLAQIPPDVTIASFASTTRIGLFDHYLGPEGRGAAVFVYAGVHDRQGNLVPDPPAGLKDATFHVKPDGSDEWHDITSGVTDVQFSRTDGP